MSYNGTREVSEEEIDLRLEEILNVPDDKQFAELTHVIKFLALNLFNLRKDYEELYKDYCELKENIMEVFKTQGFLEKPKEVLEKKAENYETKNLYL